MTDFQQSFNGLTFGGVGAAVQFVGADGLEDLPEVRTSDEARGNTDGMYSGSDLLGGRTVHLDLLIVAGAVGLSMRTVVEQLKAAFVVQKTGTLPYRFTLPGATTKRLNVRCRRRLLPIAADYPFGRAPASVELFAPDPRIYEDTASSVSVALPSAVTGRTYNRTYNLIYGAGGSGNTQVATNTGTVATKPTIVLTGPVDTPLVQNLTTGQFLRFNIVLAATDTLTIDTDARTVFLNGTTSVRTALSTDSTWWDLAPGPNTVLYGAAGFTASTATVSWRSAYL